MKALKILSYALIALTFVMIILGGVVHNTGSSLACPDWPLCFGQVFPKMEGQVAIEHSHRLLGTLIGMLCIALCVMAFRKARPLFKLTLIILAVVIFQGVLGGVTVLMKLSPIVSTAHLATSQIFFALLFYFLYHIGRLQPYAPDASIAARIAKPLSQRAYRLFTLTLIAVFVQMCLGAFIRHGGASVACGLGSQSLWLCFDSVEYGLSFWPSTGPAKTHMLHRYMGMIVGALVIFATIPTLRYAKAFGLTKLRMMIVFSHALVFFQIVLGFLTVYSFIDPSIVTLHLLFGVLLWICLWIGYLITKENYSLSLQSRPIAAKDRVLST